MGAVLRPAPHSASLRAANVRYRASIAAVEGARQSWRDTPGGSSGPGKTAAGR